MEANTHKILDVLEHIWPYVSGIVLTMAAGVRLWWYDRRQVKHRIATLEVLAEQSVTQRDLQECRDDVRNDDDSNLNKIYNKIDEITRDNSQQHQDIMNTILQIHITGDKND